jgi:hypothetical protein
VCELEQLDREHELDQQHLRRHDPDYPGLRDLGRGELVKGGQRVVLGAWLAMIVLATVRHVSDPNVKGLPPPSFFLGSGVLYTMFYGGAAFAPSLFGTLAVGTIVAAVAKPYIDARGAIPKSGPIFQLATLLDGISGTMTPTTQGVKP